MNIYWIYIEYVYNIEYKNADRQKITLYEHSSDHDGDEFTALEDDLCGVVQVAQGGIRQAHGAHC